MLILFEYDTVDPEAYAIGAFICVLNEAMDVKVSKEINSDYSLTFTYPIADEYAAAEEITVNRIVSCDNELYRIMTVEKNETNAVIYVTCLSVYDADAPTYHIPTFTVMSGVSPRDALVKAFEDTNFVIMSEDDIEALGMHWVGYDDFLIDVETTDKTSPYSIMEKIIDVAGIGEIYRDNYNIALVTYLGGTGHETLLEGDLLRLSTAKNLSSLSITRDISSMVNRLYAYGEEDMVMSSANPTGLPYIDNETSIATYGLKEGYMDFSDVTDASTLYDYACWQFSKNNDNRIDLPSVTIQGTVLDLSRLSDYADDESTAPSDFETWQPVLGRPVRFLDIDGTEYTERITKIDYYPYEPEQTSVTIGNVAKDAVFYLRQMGKAIGFNWKIF